MSIRSRMTSGSIFLLAVGLAVPSTRADCYRYISGPAEQIKIRDSCVQQLNVTPIFVRLAEDGYDLLVPSATEDVSSATFLRAAASVSWLSDPAHLASTEGVVDAMVSDPDFVLPLGTSRIEQINYTLASWLNTSGASASVSTLASSPNPPPAAVCQNIPTCTSCEYFHCGWDDSSPYQWCVCDFFGWNCCVIKHIVPPPIVDPWD